MQNWPRGLDDEGKEEAMEQVRLKMSTVVDPRLREVGLLGRFLAITLPLVAGRDGEVVGEPRVILGMLFPYGGGVSEGEIELALRELEHSGEVEIRREGEVPVVFLRRLTERVGASPRRKGLTPSSPKEKKESCAPAPTSPSQGNVGGGPSVKSPTRTAPAPTCPSQENDGGESPVKSSAEGPASGGTPLSSSLSPPHPPSLNNSPPVGVLHPHTPASGSGTNVPLPDPLFSLNKQEKTKDYPPPIVPPPSRDAEQVELPHFETDEERVAYVQGLIREIADSWGKPRNDFGDLSKISNPEVRREVEQLAEQRRAQLELKERENVPYAVILEAMNNYWGTKYRLTEAFKRMVNGRWAEGYRVRDFVAVFKNRWEKWGEDDRMKAYLRPSTVLRPSNFEAYWNDAMGYLGKKPEQKSIYKDLD